jgi:hypothetical protein
LPSTVSSVALSYYGGNILDGQVNNKDFVKNSSILIESGDINMCYDTHANTNIRKLLVRNYNF